LRIIISPSGNLYGSENVLYDYLQNSKQIFNEIYVPVNSQFNQKLTRNGFAAIGYENVTILYLKIFFKVFFKPGSSVYCNEGGHSRYIRVLAMLIPWVNFSIHIRMIEDTSYMRLRGLNKSNVKTLTISSSVSKRVHIPNSMIYDGYFFSKKLTFKSISNRKKIKIGVIGRITNSKGFNHLSQIMSKNKTEALEILLFGNIDENIKETSYFEKFISDKRVKQMGFVEDKEKIYSDLDLTLHLNEFEALGRIFFESLDFGIPFIGLNYEGIAEIAGLIDYPYVYFKEDISEIIQKVCEGELTMDKSILRSSREKAENIFSIKNYAHTLDNLIE
jgi:glycosyltransferase involved in cell wall biosynthesis